MGAALVVIKSVLGKIFSDWRIILLVCVLILGSMIVFKVRNLEKKLDKAEQQVQVEKKNNETLRNNVDILQATNEQNQATILQLEIDRNEAITALSTLSTEISAANKNFGEIRQNLEKITVAPTKLTPYLSEAVEGIQKSREVKK